MSLSLQELEHLAELARLSISDDERVKFRDECEKILDYLKRLEHVDVSSIVEMEESSVEHVRTDSASLCSSEIRESILKEFPDSINDFLRVPAVFERPKE